MNSILENDKNIDYVIYRNVLVPVTHIDNARRKHGENIFLEERRNILSILDHCLKQFILDKGREPDYKRGEYIVIKGESALFVCEPLPVKTIWGTQEIKLKPIWFRVPRKYYARKD